MTFTPYLSPDEYADYGVPEANTAQVNQATRLVDSYLGRPEGLIWSPDGNGMPAFMTNKTPTRSFTGPAVSPGMNVTLTIPFAQFGYQDVGEVAILDRGNPDIAEACVITAASSNTLTLANVQFVHAAPTVDFDLTILQEVADRVRLASSPVVRILSGFGRYGYGPGSRMLSGCENYEALLVTNYGQNSVSGWNSLDLTQWDVNYSTGTICMPRYDHENTRICYIAGWTQANLPGAIKQAVANMVGSMADDRPNGNIKVLKSGDGTIEWFGSGALDADTRGLLQPFRTVRI